MFYYYQSLSQILSSKSVTHSLIPLIAIFDLSFDYIWNLTVFQDYITKHSNEHPWNKLQNPQAWVFNDKEHGLIAFSIIQNGKQGSKQPIVSSLQHQQEVNLKKFYAHL